MKKNKTVAYMLATTLLLGGAFVGSKALFTDKATSENKLILTTGKVDIEVKEGAWMRNVQDKNNDGIIDARDDADSQKCEKSADGVFANVQPGDTFTRYISVLNGKSTYDVTMEIKKELTGNNEKLMKYIEIEDASLVDGVKEIGSGYNTGGYITVKISDKKEGAWDAFNGAGQFDLNATYTINATQKK